VSTVKKSQAKKWDAWARRNAPQVGPDRVGEGSVPWRFKMPQTLDGASRMPIPLAGGWSKVRS
jgi:hypothetical protein